MILASLTASDSVTLSESDWNENDIVNSSQYEQVGFSLVWADREYLHTGQIITHASNIVR